VAAEEVGAGDGKDSLRQRRPSASGERRVDRHRTGNAVDCMRQ
jgi:hypothetical protein